jgi:hypothetical protein
MRKVGLVIILIVVVAILAWATIFYWKYLRDADTPTKEVPEDMTELISEEAYRCFG